MFNIRNSVGFHPTSEDKVDSTLPTMTTDERAKWFDGVYRTMVKTGCPQCGFTMKYEWYGHCLGCGIDQIYAYRYDTFQGRYNYKANGTY